MSEHEVSAIAAETRSPRNEATEPLRDSRFRRRDEEQSRHECLTTSWSSRNRDSLINNQGGGGQARSHTRCRWRAVLPKQVLGHALDIILDMCAGDSAERLCHPSLGELTSPTQITVLRMCANGHSSTSPCVYAWDRGSKQLGLELRVHQLRRVTSIRFAHSGE